MQSTMLEKRLARLRALMATQNADAALLTLYENRRYYSNFTGSNGVLIVSGGGLVLVTDRRYTRQAEEQTQGVRIVEHAADRYTLVAGEIKALAARSLLIESNMSVAEYLALGALLPGIPMIPAGDALLDLRMVKDAAEIANIRTAVRLSEQALAEVAAQCKTGMTEKDIADELSYRVSRKGAEAMSFGTIVAAGERGALAHGTPTARRVQTGEMVVVDFGALYNGYCSDLTRTLLFGEVPAERLQTFDVVERAFVAALDAITPGATAAHVDEAHRKVFREAGMEHYALKGLGHGIGLEIHEHPRVVIAGAHVLRAGMVFTVEPGLYIPGSHGVRTEDDVLVVTGGVENLCTLPHHVPIAQ